MNGARARRPLAEVYAMPALLAVCSAVGLTSALLGDGPWDALSWLALAAPLAPLAVPLTRRR